MAGDNPNWLTKDFLNKCLESDEEFRNIAIICFKVSAAVPPGNNFGSKILRVNLQIKNDHENKDKFSSLIIKAPLTDGIVSEIINNVKDSEPIFYHKFIPHSNKLSKYTFAPKSFKSPLPSVIILEDLKPHDFSMADRIKQLDFEHCQLYMKAAASFHAASLAINKEDPELINSFGSSKLICDYLKTSKFNLNLNKYLLETLANRMKNKEHAEIVRGCSTRIGEMLVSSHRASGSFNTLTQGDPWITNMMFKYDQNGKVCDIKLLDFQNVSFGPSVHDIVFFMWSCANHEVRKYRFEELYHIFVDALNKNLKCLNCSEMLSYTVFMDEVKNMSSLALMTAGWMPFMLQDSTPNPEAIFTAISQGGDSLEENPFDRYYTKSFCENHLIALLDELEIHGVLEYLGEQLNDNQTNKNY